MKQSVTAAAVVLAMSAVPVIAAQNPTAPQHKKSTAPKAANDNMFVTKAAEGGMAEVEFGKLAVEKASNDQVKQFGQRMVDDHSKANDELKTIAQQKNITLPTTISAKDKAERDRLAKLSGAAFDHAYMTAMLSDHKKDVSEFRVESTSGKDADIKAFAAKTLPTLEEHLKLAQDATKAVGTSGTMKTPKK
jgi:putative membrane protein